MFCLFVPLEEEIREIIYKKNTKRKHIDPPLSSPIKRRILVESSAPPDPRLLNKYFSGSKAPYIVHMELVTSPYVLRTMLPGKNKEVAVNEDTVNSYQGKQ